MPLDHSSTQALPGNHSGSRKRTHAEITRSESQSQSPHPPSKRRRTLFSPPRSRATSSPESTSYSSDRVRFPGDGLDYRRPMTSTMSTAQSHHQDTIDLTLEDDSPPPRMSSNVYQPQNLGSALGTGPQASNAHPELRAPPFFLHNDAYTQTIIDLSTDDEDENGIIPQLEGGTRLVPSSPEVQFVGERALPQPQGHNSHNRRRPHLPTPPAMGNIGSMVSFVRGMTQNYFVNLRGNRELPEEALNRIDGLLEHPALNRGLEQPPEALIDEYEGLQMDYGRTAFNLGADLLLMEDPILQHAVSNRATDSVYKEPAPARLGFTRNYEEDDMLICGLCEDELATGKTEQKQQVWIIKQCGHAYCGDCAHGRNIAKNKNNRDSKRQACKKNNGFKYCTVPDCRKAVDSKTKMFQIYL